LEQLRALYDASFPIKYGDAFYEALAMGVYNGKPLVSVVAEINGVIIGAASASYDSSGHQLVNANREAIYILTLAVSPAWRRQGIATALMHAIATWAKAQPNVDAEYLHVLATNSSAINFYESNGFLNYKREIGFYPINNALEDAYLLVRYFHGIQAPPLQVESVWERVWGIVSRAVLRVVLVITSIAENALPNEHPPKSAETLV